jgi:hypothetical protein
VTRAERFWFEDVPPHLYALLRIAFGILGLLEVLGPWPLSKFWPLDGLVPLPGGGFGVRAALLDHGLGVVGGYALVAFLAGCFTAMALGIRSNAAVAAAFLGSLLQIHWNPLPLSSAHQVLVVILFCLLWADTGAVWSLDASRERVASGGGRAGAQPIWPLRLIQCQVVLIYASSGLWKLLGPVWRDGSGVYYALSNNLFHRAPLVVPVEISSLIALATYGTLLFELTFPLMVLTRPTRRVALAAGVVLHIALWLTLELGLFSALMIAGYLAFLDPRRVAALSARYDRSPAVSRFETQPN